MAGRADAARMLAVFAKGDGGYLAPLPADRPGRGSYVPTYRPGRRLCRGAVGTIRSSGGTG
jgi:hypothetical protein